MCGIIGYIGEKNSVPILIEGLKRLEYRGYDSAGIAIIGDHNIVIEKKAGKVENLEQSINEKKLCGNIGIGHTRWATHGEPNDINAHPHFDCNKEIAVIHNGIIENYKSLKSKLINEGHTFKSSTDTEVLAHLIEMMYRWTNDLEGAVRQALNQVEGAYGIASISLKEPDKIIIARNGSPLIIGVGENEFYIASDVSAIIKYTRQVIYIEDGEIGVIKRRDYTTKTIGNIEIKKEINEIAYDIEQIEKGGYPHFMLKEIYEQSETIRNSMRGRLLPEEGSVRLGGLREVKDKLLNADRIIITACGTSWHSALIGKYMFEQYAKIPTVVEYASEFRYREPVIKKNDIVLLISQSGETADTLAALKEAKKLGAVALGIVNVIGSSIARESDGGIYIHAGPEIGVASTKAFTSQVIALSLISIMLARMKYLNKNEGKSIVLELLALPDKINLILKSIDEIQRIADEFKDSSNFLYLGRGYNFPVALEGALKLKEISYIHAEGYPAAEMKHGPIALIDENMPVVFIAPKDDTYDKILSNIQEVKARKGKIIIITDERNESIESLSEHIVIIPHTLNLFSPILSVIPLQLLAYYIAVARGCNVDQPRNLAKSVTVE